MSVQPLQSTTPITQKGDLPSTQLVIIIQQIVREFGPLIEGREEIYKEGGILERLAAIEQRLQAAGIP